jgi:hypothetical protein
MSETTPVAVLEQPVTPAFAQPEKPIVFASWKPWEHSATLPTAFF